MISINGVESTLKRLQALDSAIEKDFIREVTHETYKQVKEGASHHFITGVMEDNIEMRVKGNAGLVWIADRNMLVNWKGKQVNYASFVIFGTKPHKIVAKNKQALKWAGLDGFVKSVNHPGYKGDNFLQSASQKVFKNLDKIFERVM